MTTKAERRERIATRMLARMCPASSDCGDRAAKVKHALELTDLLIEQLDRPSDIAQLIEAAERLAIERADGHLTIFRFTTDWKVALRTVDAIDRYDYIWNAPSYSSLRSALVGLLGEPDGHDPLARRQKSSVKSIGLRAAGDPSYDRAHGT